MTNAQFNPRQSLSGKHLTLEPMVSEHFTELFKAASDPEIWTQHPQKDRYQKAIFRDYFDSGINSEAAFVVLDNLSGEMIGSSRFENPDFNNRTIEIGWTFLVRSHWGGATNAELKDLMLTFAFQYFDEVHFCVGETNHRSQAAVRKLGAWLTKMTDPQRPGHIFFALNQEHYVGLLNYGN